MEFEKEVFECDGEKYNVIIYSSIKFKIKLKEDKEIIIIIKKIEKIVGERRCEFVCVWVDQK